MIMRHEIKVKNQVWFNQVEWNLFIAPEFETSFKYQAMSSEVEKICILMSFDCS